MSKTALISGAGVAGSTLAYWLNRGGFEVTVVERAARQRSSGNPVDVKGPAVAVAQQMGIMPQLQAARSQVSQMTFVNASGKKVARMGLGAFQGGAGDLEVEIPRADLASILLTAVRDGAEFLWGDTITGLKNRDEGVDVTFEKSSGRRFDIVVGADGLHSMVRRVTFGAESDFIRHMGMYVAASTQTRYVEAPGVSAPRKGFRIDRECRTLPHPEWNPVALLSSVQLRGSLGSGVVPGQGVSGQGEPSQNWWRPVGGGGGIERARAGAVVGDDLFGRRATNGRRWRTCGDVCGRDGVGTEDELDRAVEVVGAAAGLAASIRDHRTAPQVKHDDGAAVPAVVRISGAVRERGVVSGDRHVGHFGCAVFIVRWQAFEQPFSTI